MRERAVRMVAEVEEQGGNRYGVIPRIARQLGVGVEPLRTWVLQHETDTGRSRDRKQEQGERNNRHTNQR
jgi:hypothetical protein